MFVPTGQHRSNVSAHALLSRRGATRRIALRILVVEAEHVCILVVVFEHLVIVERRFAGQGRCVLYSIHLERRAVASGGPWEVGWGGVEGAWGLVP